MIKQFKYKNNINPIYMENIHTLEDAKQFIEQSQHALHFYQNHLKSAQKYQKANPEKTFARVKKHYQKIKNTDPEKYERILESKRKYYQEVVKPKNKK